MSLLLLLSNFKILVTLGAEKKVVYFHSSFSYTQSPDFDYYDRWQPKEPVPYNLEKGKWGWITTRDWGGNMYLIPDPANNDRASLKMVLDVPRHTGDNPAKLYNLQDYPSMPSKSDNVNWNVDAYISRKEAYYSFKIWFPSDFKLLSNEWRLIFQICGEQGVYGKEVLGPQASLIFHDDGILDACVAHLDDAREYYHPNNISIYDELMNYSELPKEQWVHFVYYYKQGSSFRSLDGTIKIWVDSVRTYERNDLPTATPSGTPFVIWGIGNYAGSVTTAGQALLFKDVMATSYNPITEPPPNGPPQNGEIDYSLVAVVSIIAISTVTLIYMNLRKRK